MNMDLHIYICPSDAKHPKIQRNLVTLLCSAAFTSNNSIAMFKTFEQRIGNFRESLFHIPLGALT